MPRLPIDWDLIRIRYESGQTPYAISRDLGGTPTKQGITKRAAKHGWTRMDNGVLAVAEALPIVQRARSLTGPTKCTAERVAFVLDLVSNGASIKLAANAAGIDPKTLKRWCADDPQLEEQLRQARAGKLAEWVSHIDRAARTDWKAAKSLLESSPDADGFNTASHGGITIVLNIDREAGVIGPHNTLHNNSMPLDPLQE